jgi:GcrA cell cycle regulator
MFAAFRMLCADQSLTFRVIRDKMNAMFDLDLSRNACIGKAHRLRLPAREITNNPAHREKAAVTKKPFSFAPIPPELPPRSTEPFTIDIYQLRTQDCRWPSGYRAPYTYCGRKALSGLPYCPIHTQLARGSQRAKPQP